MRSIWMILLPLTACGGAAFSTIDLPAADASDAGSDASDVPDSEASAPDGADAPDSGGAESGPDAAGDTSNDTATEAPGEASDAPACVLGAAFACNGNSSPNELTTPPMQFCVCSNGACSNAYGPDKTPSECTTCETYTCACMQTYVSDLFKSCSETNGQITVVLQ
jgi:hypothetical protein